jgi:hypothetical protein
MKVIEQISDCFDSGNKIVVKNENNPILKIWYDYTEDVDTGGREERIGLWNNTGHVGSVCFEKFKSNNSAGFKVGKLSEQSSTDYEIYMYENDTRVVSLSFNYITVSYDEDMNKKLLLWKNDMYIGSILFDKVSFRSGLELEELFY